MDRCPSFWLLWCYLLPENTQPRDVIPGNNFLSLRSCLVLYLDAIWIAKSGT